MYLAAEAEAHIAALVIFFQHQLNIQFQHISLSSEHLKVSPRGFPSNPSTRLKPASVRAKTRGLPVINLNLSHKVGQVTFSFTWARIYLSYLFLIHQNRRAGLGTT
jgi:hypothetical protein